LGRVKQIKVLTGVRKFFVNLMDLRILLKGEKMKKIIQVAVIMLTLSLFLGACLPAATQGQQPAPQVQNTQSLPDTQSNVNTAVAQTIEAQSQIGTSVALTTEAQYTATPTATEFTIPTLTPFVISTPTNRPSSGGSGSSAHAKADYSCDIILLRPRAYAEFHRGQKFDIKMTVVNNGARSWYQGFDLKYAGGSKFTPVTHVELPAMAPNARHEVILDAVVPDQRGDLTMTWTVEGRICFGYVTITVK
jgi:hypothetical protein